MLHLRQPDDWHLHLRDGAALAAVLPHTAAQFARAIVMPNLKPPVTTTALAAAYRDRILAARPAGSGFEPLMTLYLTDNTPAAEIRRARESGFVHGCKLYPAGATTHSDAGVTDIAAHRRGARGHGRSGPAAARARRGHARHRSTCSIARPVSSTRCWHRCTSGCRGCAIVFEHVTTRAAVEFVRSAAVASPRR